LFVIFSILDVGRKNQWSRHLFEKSIPGLFYSKPLRKVSATELELRTTKLKKPEKTTNLFSNLDFLSKSAFPKILDLSMDFPRISHPMDCRGGRGSGRQKTKNNKYRRVLPRKNKRRGMPIIIIMGTAIITILRIYSHGAHRMLQMRIVTEFDPVGERRWWSRQREGVAILVV
jgi:hypothetical protein